ncbi:MAG TPA: RICIN domain-containing protein [Flavisolibacter sp.]|nr:RICIN domain-containing protein [Flavisolibacter sp.]
MKKTILLLAMFFAVFFAQAQPIKGTYAIKNVETGLLLRIKDANKANGTPLVLYTQMEWKCMTWDFRQVEGETYQLKNLFTGKTFQPADSLASGVGLEEQPLLANADAQQYEFIPVEKSVYFIRLKNTGLYLTPSEKSNVNSAVVLAEKTGAKNQYWTLYEQHPQF